MGRNVQTSTSRLPQLVLKSWLLHPHFQIRTIWKRQRQSLEGWDHRSPMKEAPNVLGKTSQPLITTHKIKVPRHTANPRNDQMRA